jgi:hypothetical protein
LDADKSATSAISGYNKAIQFVCCHDFVSTNVGTCGQSNNEIIQTPMCPPSINRDGFSNKHLIDTNVNNCVILHLIDLQPHRKFVEITIKDARLVEKES